MRVSTTRESQRPESVEIAVGNEDCRVNHRPNPMNEANPRRRVTSGLRVVRAYSTISMSRVSRIGSSIVPVSSIRAVLERCGSAPRSSPALRDVPAMTAVMATNRTRVSVVSQFEIGLHNDSVSRACARAARPESPHGQRDDHRPGGQRRINPRMPSPAIVAPVTTIAK